MEQRTLGRTGHAVSVVGLGTWQLGADWGDVCEADAREVLEASVEEGSRSSTPRTSTATGAASRSSAASWRTPGRRHHGRDQDGPPRRPGARELRARQLPRLDRPLPAQPRRRHPRPRAAALPADARSTPTTQVYDALDTLVDEGAIAAYGVSVEKVDQALAAIARPHVATVQIIANAFRLKPVEEVFPAAAEAGRRHHRPGAARLRPALRAVRRRHDVRATTTTAPSTGDGRRSTSARRSRAWTSRPALRRRRSSARWSAQKHARRRHVRRRRPSPGCGSSPVSAASSPARATSSRPAATPRAGGYRARRGVRRGRAQDLRPAGSGQSIHPRW